MCNRFRQVKTRENLSLIFGARPIADPAEPRTDIYPKYSAWIVRRDAGERILDHMPWGIPLSMRGKQGQPLAPKPGKDEERKAANWWFHLPASEVKAMPVILDPADYDGWLDGTFDDACALAVPFPSQLMAVA